MKGFDVFKAIKMTNGQKTIVFIREGSKFICEDKRFSKVIIDLKGYIFKKSYIASYVIRTIRYREVSHKCAFSMIFLKKTLDLSVIDNLELIIIDNDKKYSKKLVKNSCSKISILNKFILGSKHAKYICLPTKRGDIAEIAKRNRTAFGINEELYQSGDFGFYKKEYSKHKKRSKGDIKGETCAYNDSPLFSGVPGKVYLITKTSMNNPYRDYLFRFFIRFSFYLIFFHHNINIYNIHLELCYLIHILDDYYYNNKFRVQMII